jgi:hypothetical protein
MSIFKRRKEPKTRIIKRPEPPVSPMRVAVTTVLNTPRFEIRRDEFQGFDSPPGRF